MASSSYSSGGRKSSSSDDYDTDEQEREKKSFFEGVAENTQDKKMADSDEEDLEIPAFIRKKMM